MWPDRVVVEAERIELLLQLRHGGCRWLTTQEIFQGLPHFLNFSLGSGFVGFSVALNDAFNFQQGLARVRVAFSAGSSRVTGGIDHPVIGQCGAGLPVLRGGFTKSGGHDAASDSAMRG